jgi:serine/threonine protein phosphatase PrpC
MAIIMLSFKLLQDQLIGEDKQKYKVKGGCTALVALFILGKMYIANAGDSRAVLCKNRHPLPLSNDFTPETERQRIRQLVNQKTSFEDRCFYFGHLEPNQSKEFSDIF